MDNLNTRKISIATLLDNEKKKAFNNVWHTNFIKNYIIRCLPLIYHHYKVLIGILNVHIKIGDESSSNRSIDSRIRQGLWILPQLISIDINDMPKHQNAKISLFIYDVLLYTSNITNNAVVKNFQVQIYLSISWFKDWKISIKPSKTSNIIVWIT